MSIITRIDRPHYAGYPLPRFYPARVGQKGPFVGYAKRNSSTAGDGKSQGEFPGKVDAKNFPALVEYLTMDKWEDGTKRETSTLLMFVNAGSLTAALNDRDQGQTLWVSEDSFNDVLTTLEEHLREGTGTWRRNSANGKGGKKK